MSAGGLWTQHFICKKIARKEFMEHDIFTLFGTGRARQFLVGNFLKIKRLEAFIDHTKDVISITHFSWVISD